MKNFLNRKVNVKIVQHKTKYGITESCKLDDLVFVNEVKKEFGDLVRFKMLGGIYTQDFRPERTNIHISKEGFVTNITKG